jgi:glycosyltransferase involved in cell wall biosynthesis
VRDAAEPLRVLLVSANYKPSVGGIERYVENLAHGLAGRGHSVTVAACRTDGGAKDEHDGDVRIVRIPATDVLDKRLNVPYPLPAPIAAWRTLRHLLGSADLMHAHDALYPTSVTSLALASHAHVPSVLTQHVSFVPQRNRALDAAQRLAIGTLGRSAKRATRIATYNPAVAEWARTIWGLPDVQVLPAGVPDAPPVDRMKVRDELGLAPDRFVALFVGRDVPKKGLDILLAARDPSFDVLAVTDRKGAASESGIRLLPFMAPERLREVMCSVDAFVLPSEGEGFPLALQEALVTGLPCVVVAGPGYERYLHEGEALLVHPEPHALRDGLRTVAEDDALRRRLAGGAREAGRREFGLERFVVAYEQLYREAVQAAQPMPVRP